MKTAILNRARIRFFRPRDFLMRHNACNRDLSFIYLPSHIWKAASENHGRTGLLKARKFPLFVQHLISSQLFTAGA